MVTGKRNKGYTETIDETLMIVTEQTGSAIGPEDKPTGKTISQTAEPEECYYRLRYISR